MPTMIMFDICKVYPIWVPPWNGIAVDIDDAFGVAMLEIRENVIELNKACYEIVKDITKIAILRFHEVIKGDE